MKTSMQCPVIRDMLPIYLDQEASRETAERGEEHLEECALCRDYLEDMKQEEKNRDTGAEGESDCFYQVAKRIRRRKIKGVLITGLIIVLMMWAVLFSFSRVIVTGTSMEPSVRDGQSLWVNKIVYRLKAPRRLDIVLYRSADNGMKIKRIIGLPGETLEIRNQEIYINGNMLDRGDNAVPIEQAGEMPSPIVLGQDEYFMLGDNTSHSLDSRYSDHGLVKRDAILGRIICQ